LSQGIHAKTAAEGGAGLIASRLPVWLTVLIAITRALFAGFMIRDYPTLNLIMLVWRLGATRQWQTSANPQ